MEELDSQSIPNFTMFEASYVQIQLFKSPYETDDEESYHAALLIFLDDASETEDYNVTIFINVINEDPESCAKLAFLYASVLFDNISPIVSVWLDTDEQGEDIDLRTKNLVPNGVRVH